MVPFAHQPGMPLVAALTDPPAGGQTTGTGQGRDNFTDRAWNGARPEHEHHRAGQRPPARHPQLLPGRVVMSNAWLSGEAPQCGDLGRGSQRPAAAREVRHGDALDLPPHALRVRLGTVTYAVE